jgi:hypothetical protein
MLSHAKISRQIALGGASLLLAQACTPVPRAYPTQFAYAPAYPYRQVSAYRPANTYPYRTPAVPPQARATPTSTPTASATDEGLTAGQVLVGAAFVGAVACVLMDCLGTSPSRPAPSTSSDSSMRSFLEKQARERQSEKRFELHQADWINKFHGSGP